MPCYECYISFIITEPSSGSVIIGHDITNIFHDFKIVFIQLNEATNHTMHILNHGELSTFIALSEALKGGFIITYIIIYNLYFIKSP